MIEKIIASGSGGEGVVLLGELIARAYFHKGYEIAYSPDYGPEMRGGAANQRIVVSDGPVMNPVVSDPDVLIVMNRPSMIRFIGSHDYVTGRQERISSGGRVNDQMLKIGGILLYNSSFVKEDDVPERPDLTIYPVPAPEIADGSKWNMVLLGAYAQISGGFGIDTLEEVFRREFTGGKAKFIDGNLKNCRIGMDYVKGMGR